MIDELPLPAELGCERMTLGALLNAPDAIDLNLANLSADDFSTEPHKRIYLRMCDLRRDGEPVDRVTLAYALKHAGQLESVGGVTYLVNLDTDMPHLAEIGAWIGILREKAIARQVILLTGELQARCRRGEDPVSLLGALRTSGERLMRGNGHSFQTSREIIEEIGQDEFFTPVNSLGIEPPISWLAERFRFTPQSQTILAAMTGAGKTALALQCALEAAVRGYRTAFYSLEMRNVENLRRIVGQLSRVNMHRMRMGIASAEERASASYALSKIVELEDLILFRDTPVDVQCVNNDLQRLAMQGTPAQFGVIDHIGLVQTPGRTENRAQEVSALSKGFKLTWKRFNMAGLVLCQFNQQGDETTRPSLKWLKDSSSIQQDADHIIFSWARTVNDKDADVREWCCELAKNRTGPCGKFDMMFERKYTRFSYLGG